MGRVSGGGPSLSARYPQRAFLYSSSLVRLLLSQMSISIELGCGKKGAAACATAHHARREQDGYSPASLR